MQESLVTRAARDADSDGLIGLIGGVFAEYPGCVLDVEREEPDLLAIASAYASKGGQFWITLDERVGALVGCVGWVPGAAPGRPGWLELRKLYVARPYRRRGLARALVDRVETAARERGAAGVELWSDTRFRDAHRFYVARGYVQQAGSRELFDVSQSIEFHFLRSFAG